MNSSMPNKSVCLLTMKFDINQNECSKNKLLILQFLKWKFLLDYAEYVINAAWQISDRMISVLESFFIVPCQIPSIRFWDGKFFFTVGTCRSPFAAVLANARPALSYFRRPHLFPTHHHCHFSLIFLTEMWFSIRLWLRECMFVSGSGEILCIPWNNLLQH